MAIKAENSETEIIKYIRKGKYKKAFERVYELYSSQIYTYCLKFMGDKTEAEDAFQEAMMKFLLYIKENREINNISGLLFRIAKNTCLNRRRSGKTKNVELEESHLVCTENNMESIELNSIIEHALNKIPVEHKEAFILQVFEGFSYKEIANILDIPISTVRNRVVRAKREVREYIKSYQTEAS